MRYVILALADDLELPLGAVDFARIDERWHLLGDNELTPIVAAIALHDGPDITPQLDRMVAGLVTQEGKAA